MTVAQLIEELQKFPQDMPIAINDDISWVTKENPHHIFIERCTWIHSNWPYDKPEFDYINLE